jgi:hypothetical protein
MRKIGVWGRLALFGDRPEQSGPGFDLPRHEALSRRCGPTCFLQKNPPGFLAGRILEEEVKKERRGS